MLQRVVVILCFLSSVSYPIASKALNTDMYYLADEGDSCPNDPNKDAPGLCGCGFVDTDTDNDGFADCVESCIVDPLKIRPGVCGCGIPDKDSDKDGRLDCTEECPNDPSKFTSGKCGCGFDDKDINDNGIIDCFVGDELKDKLNILSQKVRALKRLDPNASISKVKKLKAQVKSVLDDLDLVVTYGNENSNGIILVNTIRPLSILLSSLVKRVKKASLIDSETFEMDRRNARIAIHKLSDFLS